MESVISIILGREALIGRIMVQRLGQSIARHHSFYLSLKTGLIALLKCVNKKGTNHHLSLKRSYIWVLVLEGFILIYIGQY